jgi:3-methyladenine DNA glycosylase AlkD
MDMLSELKKDMKEKSDNERAKNLSRFFKTGRGEYGEGDIFLGITVPNQRNIVKKYWEKINLKETEELLKSKFHEERLTALLILVKKYSKSDEKEKEEIFNFYLSNTKYINNWDLVDLSAPNIIGNFILNKNHDILYKLAKSENLWEKRISIISTATFIRSNQFEDTIKISEILLNEKHDLIHKAVGWMLREIGKRNKSKLEKFLKKYHKKMPRTMLRYAIEKFPENERKGYLNKV